MSDVNQMSFFEESFDRLKKWRVKHVSTTFHSNTIKISDFCRIFDNVSKKMTTSAKNNDDRILQVSN